MYVAATPESLRRIRHEIRRTLKRAKAAHIAEALARAAGFKTAIALKRWERGVTTPSPLRLDTAAFHERLESLGYGYEITECTGALEQARLLIEHETVEAQQEMFSELIANALSRDASDIHIKVRPKGTEVFLRVAGKLQKAYDAPKTFGEALCSQASSASLSVDGKPRAAEGPWSGHIIWPGLRGIGLQVYPLGNGGQYMNLRLVRAEGDGARGKHLGYPQVFLDKVEAIAGKPYGLVVVCGPSHAGKSGKSTLSALIMGVHQRRADALRGGDGFVSCMELPKNSYQTEPGSEQSREWEVMTSALRREPDMVLFGDIETGHAATSAFSAAMTGHFVCTRMHSPDMFSAFDVLQNWGADDYKVFDRTLLAGVVHQRLMPRLCEACSIPLAEAIFDQRIPAPVMEKLRGLGMSIRKVRTRRADGCHACAGRGRSGLVPVCEAVIPDAQFMSLMRDGNRERALAWWQDQLDGTSIGEHAVARMLQGELDPGDVDGKFDLGTVLPGRNDVIRRLMR